MEYDKLKYFETTSKLTIQKLLANPEEIVCGLLLGYEG
jgi:hypothetical protein